MRPRRRNRSSEIEADAEGTWAVSYGDMVTLLLTFFILFFNVNASKGGKAKEKALEDSLIVRLSKELLPKHGGYQAVLDIAETQGKGIDTSLEDKFGAKIEKAGSKVIVEFPGVNFYDFAETDLNSDGKQALDKFTKAFLPYAGNYIVMARAFTDDSRVDAKKHHKYKDNIELSVFRALSALRHLQYAGIPLRRLRPGGFGELHLLEKRMPASVRRGPGNPLARKVVLVLEPEGSDGRGAQ